MYAHICPSVHVLTISQESATPIRIDSWKLSPDMKYILVKTDYVKVRLDADVILHTINSATSNGVTLVTAITTFMK
jgi:hypothetical protein